MCLTDKVRLSLTQRTKQLNEAAKAADEKLRKVAEFFASEDAPRINVRGAPFHVEGSDTYWTSYRLVYARHGSGGWGLWVEEEENQAQVYEDQNGEQRISRDRFGDVESDVLSIERKSVDQYDRSMRLKAARSLPGVIDALDSATNDQLKDLS